MPSGPPNGLLIRTGVPDDLDAVVRLHVAVWRDTYRYLAPDEAIRRLDKDARRPHWVEPLRDGSVLVATSGERLAGFARVGPPGHPALGRRGEIKHLYVGPDFARRGLGARLLAAARDRLAEHGFPSAALGVVVGNERALRFYEAQGGRVVGRYRDPGPIWPSDNLVVAWDA